MNKKRLYLTSFVASISLLFYGPATAQRPHPDGGPRLPDAETRPFWPQPIPGFTGQSAAPMGAFGAQAAAFSIGQPGLSFRYVQTFGVTEEPFIETNDHFYWVEGVGTVGNAVWIADTLAHRVLKFDASGNFLQQIGKAGVIDYSGTALARITDVAEDNSGTLIAS